MSAFYLFTGRTCLEAWPLALLGVPLTSPTLQRRRKSLTALDVHLDRAQHQWAPLVTMWRPTAFRMTRRRAKKVTAVVAQAQDVLTPMWMRKNTRN